MSARETITLHNGKVILKTHTDFLPTTCPLSYDFVLCGIWFSTNIRASYATQTCTCGDSVEGLKKVAGAKGYSVDIAPVSLVDQSSRLQRHWFMYQLHILNKFWGFKQTQRS